MSRLRAELAVEIDLPGRPTFVYSDATERPAPVQLYGMFRGCVSVDNVCTQFARRLLAAIPDANVHGYTGRPFFEPDLEAHAFIDPAAPIGIFYGTPDTVPERLFAHETAVGGFVCESDAIPPHWVRICNRLDLVLVPSRFCRAAFRASGVTTPVLVVPHGLEPEYRPRGGKRRREPFVFYATANTNTVVRKGMTELVRSFRRAFGERPDVRLRLRVGRSGALLETLAECDVRPDDPTIRVEPPEPLSTAEFAGLYSRVHCTVHPSKGEGFGLIPLQSIACETPVIAPCATGMADYLSPDNAMVLRTAGWTDAAQVYYGTGGYAEIDQDHLVDLLRHAEANWEAEYARVRAVAPSIREAYTWENALSGIMALLLELRGTADPVARREAIDAWAIDAGVGAVERPPRSDGGREGSRRIERAGYDPAAAELPEIDNLEDVDIARARASGDRARWGRSLDRLAPEAWPVFEPGFTLEPGARVFTVGSCFARNIEDYLDLVGCDLPTLKLRAPEAETSGRPTQVLNRYTPPTILQELAWAAGARAGGGDVDERDLAAHRLELSDGRVVDLQVRYAPVSEERFVERRRQIHEVFSQAFRSDCVVITLGHVEGWYDEATGLFVWGPPLQLPAARRQRERFRFRELTFAECLDNVRDTVEIIRSLNSSCPILLSVSPVPLRRTFTGRDVIVANEHSKCLLRTVAERVARSTPGVDYFPSYETVRLTRGRRVVKADLRHVDEALVGRIAQRFVAACSSGLGEREERLLAAAVALESGGEPRHVCAAPVRELSDLESYRISQLVLLTRLCALLGEIERGRDVVAELMGRPGVGSWEYRRLATALKVLGCHREGRVLAEEMRSARPSRSADRGRSRGGRSNRRSAEPGRLDRWRDAHGRLLPEVWPVCPPSFSLAPGASVFGVGSCFARSIEDYLHLLGFEIPMLSFEADPAENDGRNEWILNKYTPPMIYQELAWAAGVAARGGVVGESEIEAHRFEVSAGRVQDLQLNSKPVGERRFVERRRDVYRIFSKAFESDCVLITLGHMEAWYDRATDLFVGGSIPLLKEAHRSGRFAFVELTLEQCRAYLERTVALLRSLNPRCGILVTTSPVPLSHTFTGRDVILANEYSKSLLRVVAERVARATPRTDYFPSFESVRMTRSPYVLRKDLRHVQGGFVGKIARRVVDNYTTGLSSRDERLLAAKLALRCGGEPRATVRAPLREVGSLSTYNDSQLCFLIRICEHLGERREGIRIARELERRSPKHRGRRELLEELGQLG